MHCQCGNDKWIWKTKVYHLEDIDKITKTREKVCSKCGKAYPKPFDDYAIF